MLLIVHYHCLRLWHHYFLIVRFIIFINNPYILHVNVYIDVCYVRRMTYCMLNTLGSNTH
ncbi:unnamed protein product [Spirodela intermedia]|uniref:Uncharacterized protein n=1 Tax=Spirodela intermedia TaxID=51605 RepID=A0ABN7ECQ1_SPIIN|nr:unnamed protein product [Spirodela intermedia]